MGDVYLLGAGFSRAVAGSMPLLRELSERVRARYNRGIPEDVAALMDENFELALSYLSQSKPWLPETDNLRHRALLLDLSNVVAGVLQEATTDAVALMATEAPAWLERLIRHWHLQRSTVLTLNYDTLVEVVASGMEAAPDNPHHIECRHIYPPILTNASFRRGAVSVGSHLPSFRLIKLHGSINWFYSGRAESFGEPIYYVSENGGPAAFWQRQQVTEEGLMQEIMADKFPFIVPPVFDKAPLFTHETIRSLWFRAAQALRKADRVVCIGYSMPESDLTMRHFLRSALAGREVPVEIVNLDDLRSSYQRVLGSGRYQLAQRFVGEECVPRFAAALSAPTPNPQ
jgi:hypothetical protein